MELGLQTILIFFSTLLGFSSFAATAVPSKKQAEAEINSALKTLQQKSGVHLEVKKRTFNSLMGREKKSEGELYYWQGKLRLELRSPEDSTLVLDGKTVWLATKLGEDLGGKTMVTKTKARDLKKSSPLMAALFSPRHIFNEFKVKTREQKAENLEISLEAKDTQAEVQRLDVVIQDKKLTRVTYWDSSENEVTFDLTSAKPLMGDKTKLFSYTPPKGAEVTEI